MPFHVPEASRLIDGPMPSPRGALYGAFLLDSPEPGWRLLVIADDGTDTDVPDSSGWEHVSVSARNNSRVRTPSWGEMAFIKTAFWDDDDAVVQFHPRRAVYVNCHPHVLHLWRHKTLAFPEPPPHLVGAVERER